MNVARYQQPCTAGRDVRACVPGAGSTPHGINSSNLSSALQVGTTLPLFHKEPGLSKSHVPKVVGPISREPRTQASGPVPRCVLQPGCASIYLRCEQATDAVTQAAVFVRFAHFTVGVFVFFLLISQDTLHVKNSKLCLFWLLTFSLWRVFTPTLQPSLLLILSAGTWARGGAPDPRP